jgi:hypothetical protein
MSQVLCPRGMQYFEEHGEAVVCFCQGCFSKLMLKDKRCKEIRRGCERTGALSQKDSLCPFWVVLDVVIPVYEISNHSLFYTLLEVLL